MREVEAERNSILAGLPSLCHTAASTELLCVRAAELQPLWRVRHARWQYLRTCDGRVPSRITSLLTARQWRRELSDINVIRLRESTVVITTTSLQTGWSGE